jgi:class 3 adenylate cyclase/putative methionine-R-sulfoxide reductase with GAF domain
LSLFHKLLGFLILCLTCGGLLVAWLVTQQMSGLVYDQALSVFKNDRRQLNISLREHQTWLRQSALEISRDEGLTTAVELEVVEEIQKITNSFQTDLGLDDVLVVDRQRRVLSRGYDNIQKLAAEWLVHSEGVINKGGLYQIFSRAPVLNGTGETIGDVLLVQVLTGNRQLFEKLIEGSGKEAIFFFDPVGNGDGKIVSELGSTLDDVTMDIERNSVAPGLFTAKDGMFIGAVLPLDYVFGRDNWNVILLQNAESLKQSILRVQWGGIIITIAFIGLVAWIVGLFFSANIRKPMELIRQGLAAVTQGNLDSRLKLNRRDEWDLIEVALNSMTDSLSATEAAVRRNVRETTALYEIGQDIAEEANLDGILDMVVQHGHALLRTEFAGLALCEPGTDTFRLRAQSGTIDEALVAATLDSEHGLGRRVISAGLPVRVGDYLTEHADSPVLDLVRKSGMRSWMGVPLQGQDQIIGLLYLRSSTPNFFDEEALRFFSALASQATIAIEKASLNEQIRAHAAELEVRVAERTAELDEKSNALEQLSNQLAKYLSPQVYDSIFSGKQEVKVASSRKKLTVFFSDIVEFTETADRLQSEELTELLNHYLTEMSQIALEHGATIDKYVGDAIVIFFGDPESNGVKEDALACVRMAIAMRNRMLDLQHAWRESGIEKPWQCRMGIHTDYCTVGNFGSETRMDYTIIGGGVNTASRLETSAIPGEILISYETYAHVSDQISCKEHGKIEVKGIAYPVATYQVVDTHETLGQQRRRFREENPTMKLDLDLDAMTSSDRDQALEVLRRAQDLLSRDDEPDHALSATKK